MDTRSAERSDASLKDTAKPLYPGSSRDNGFIFRGRASRDGKLAGRLLKKSFPALRTAGIYQTGI